MQTSQMSLFMHSSSTYSASGRLVAESFIALDMLMTLSIQIVVECSVLLVFLLKRWDHLGLERINNYIATVNACMMVLKALLYKPQLTY
jgi:hypothetical protein